MTEPTTDPTCLFCRIVRGDIPATLVAETPECVAFRDINPQAPVHVLVIPREHVASLDAARDPALVGRLALLAAARVEQRVLLELLGDKGLDLEIGQRQQLDRLLQLRRHHQRLGLP